MKLRNEFSIGAPIDQTWDMLLDIQRVAQCLPGAKIEPADGDGVYRGQMKVRLGPMTVEYQGTARLGDVDEDEHVATIDVKGKEARGQGTASATITNSVAPEGDRTKVVVETDLNVTGRPAQFGRGIMEDVATSMMKQFATRLEEEIKSGRGAASAQAANGAGTPPAAAAAPKRAASPSSPPAPQPGDDDDVLNVGSVLANTQMLRYAGIAGGVLLLVIALIAILSGRRRALNFNVNIRR